MKPGMDASAAKFFPPGLVILFAAVLGLLLAGLAASSARAAALTPERAGAFYVGESSTGDGFIGGGDVTILTAAIKNPASASYGNCDPPDKSIQDVNGDGFLGALDTTIISGWTKGSFPLLAPIDLYVMDDMGLPSNTDVTLFYDGYSELPISARARQRDTGVLRSGFGIVFTATSNNPSCTPVLEGHNPLSNSTIRPDIIQADRVHAFTQRPSLPDDGWATVSVVGAVGCNFGDTIRIATMIPNDTLAGVGGKRVPTSIVGPDIVLITSSCSGCCGLVSITMTGPTVLTELASAPVTATCTYDDLSSDDCSLTGGIICSDATGNISLNGCLVTANPIPGPGGGSGYVTVTSGSACGPQLSDGGPITILNDDTVVAGGVDVTPNTPVLLPPGGTQDFACSALFTDSYTDDCSSALTLTTSGCGALSGPLYTAPLSVCNDTVAVANFLGSGQGDSSAITVAGCIPSSLNCTLANITEGQTGSYTCTDDCGNAVAATTVNGACTGGNGSITANENNCSTASGSCSINAADLTSAAVAVNDDGDAQNGLSCTPASLTERAAGVVFTCTQLWNEDTCAAGNANTAATTLSGGCTKVDNTHLNVASANCTAAPANCVFTNNTFISTSTVPNIDTITSVSVLPASFSAGTCGGTQVFTCTAACSDVPNTENCLSGTAMTGACGTYTVGTGTWTAPCSGGSCNGTITGTWKSVVDPSPTPLAFYCVATGITCTVNTITEGAAGTTFTCTDTCGVNVTSTVTVGGASACTKAGAGPYTIAAPEANCSTAAGACTITQGALPAWPVTVNDDGDVRVGIDVNRTTITEGTTGAYTCTDLWNEGACGASCTAASVVSGGCTGSAGGITGKEDNCSTATAVCTVTANTFTDTVTRIDDGDFPIIAVLNPQNPYVLRGRTQQFTIDQSWNEGSPGCLTHPAGTGWTVIPGTCSPVGTMSGATVGLYKNNATLDCTEQVDTNETAPTTVNVTCCCQVGIHDHYEVFASNVPELAPVTYGVYDVDDCGNYTIMPGETVTIASGACSYQLSNLKGTDYFAVAGDFPAGWTGAGTVAPGWQDAGQGGFTQGSVRFPGTAYGTAPPANVTSSFTVGVNATNHDTVVLSGTYCACRTDSQAEAVTIQYNCGTGFVAVTGTSYWTDGGGTSNNCACGVGGQDRHNFSYNLSSMDAACNNNTNVQARFYQSIASPAATERTFIDDITITAHNPSVIVANHVACGAGGSCTLTAADIGGEAIAPVPVTVTNDDTIISELITGLPGAANENSVLPFAVTRTWSDSCTEDLTLGSTCSGGCTGGDGVCTMNQAPCGAAPPNCEVSDSDATNSPRTVVVVNNDTVLRTLIEGAPTEALEDEVVSFAVNRYWSDGCIQDLSLGSTCAGGCTGGDGFCTMSSASCNVQPYCTISAAAAQNGPRAITVRASETVVSNYISAPASVMEGDTFRAVFMATYSDGCTVATNDYVFAHPQCQQWETADAYLIDSWFDASAEFPDVWWIDANLPASWPVWQDAGIGGFYQGSVRMPGQSQALDPPAGTWSSLSTTVETNDMEQVFWSGSVCACNTDSEDEGVIQEVNCGHGWYQVGSYFDGGTPDNCDCGAGGEDQYYFGFDLSQLSESCDNNNSVWLRFLNRGAATVGPDERTYIDNLSVRATSTIYPDKSAMDIPCGDGASCTLYHSGVPDVTVTITNDDTVVSAELYPLDPSVPERGDTTFTMVRNWSDGCADLPPGTGWAVVNSTCEFPGSVTADGWYTAGYTPCMPGCTEEVDTAESAAAGILIGSTIVDTYILPGETVNVGYWHSKQFSKMAAWGDGCIEDISDVTDWNVVPGTCPMTGTITPDGLYSAQSLGLCSEFVSANSYGTDDWATVNLGPCGTFDHYEVRVVADPLMEGQIVPWYVASMDNCGQVISALPGETVTPSGDCHFQSFQNASNSYITTPSDTAGDTLNGVSDLAFAEGTFADPVGKYVVPGGKKMSVRGSSAMLATLNSVTLRVICGRSGSINPTLDAVRYSLDGGSNFTNTTITCADGSNGAYKPEQTDILDGVTGWGSIANLVIEYDAAGGNASRHIGFDTVTLDYNLSALFADEIPCSDGGTCTLTAADIGGEPVTPAVVTVANDDMLMDVNITPVGPLFIGPWETQAFTCAATFDDTCVEDCLPGTMDQSGCGAYDPATGIYTCPAMSCFDIVHADWMGMSDPSPTGISCAP